MAESTQHPQQFLHLKEKILHRKLCFYSPPEDESDPEYIAETTEVPGRRNYPHREETVPIRDIRGHERDFTLDSHSFTALPNRFNLGIDFTKPEDITEKYLPWVKDLLFETLPGSQSVCIFDYTLRKASSEKRPSRQVHKIHIDQSPNGALLRARRHLPPKDVAAIENGKAHFRIINVWKPIFRPVRDHPLAVAEFRSLQAADLVPVRQVYPDYVGETYAVMYRYGQRFRYWSDMMPFDVLLFQCFDSRERRLEGADRGGLKYAQCAHGSFRLTEEGDEPCTRESIEIVRGNHREHYVIGSTEIFVHFYYPMNPPADDTWTATFSSEDELLVSQVLLLRDDSTVSPEALKRKLGEENIDYDDTGSIADRNSAPIKRSKPKVKNHDGPIVDRKLACPFFKRDGHNKAITRICMGPGWSSVGRVKEHIYRRHMPPKHQCCRCRKVFSSENELAAHLRTLIPCPVHDAPLPETITRDQATQLRHRGGKLPDASDEEKWKSMYRVLFPDDNYVPGPYYDESCGHCISKADSRLLNDYRQYQSHELAPLVQRELSTIPADDLSDELRARFADLLPRLNAKVLDDFYNIQGAASGRSSRLDDSTQCSEGLEGMRCETPHQLLNSTIPAVNNVLSNHDLLSFDLSDPVDVEFDFGVEGKWE
ncbi:hypothetical protein HD806DRAFT_521007 [Xylariaceae sp. AK1471]|nr:hypothetical protein HD806DRAFT_521007 [Xylariaceae sp. AK1471]